MEDPQREEATNNGDPLTSGERVSHTNGESGEELQQRREEEAMERMLLAQEEEGEEGIGEGGLNNGDGIVNNNNVEGGRINDDHNFAEDDGHEDIPFLDNETMNNDVNFQNFEKKNPFTYVRVSFCSAIFLVYYAFRSRQQFYLALVFLSSSKWAYVILGNSLVASLIWSFQTVTGLVLNGLRLHEAEGLSDFFRWHITEACLALTIFRSELDVKTGISFLVLVFAKCLHWVVDMRESHLRMTEEVVIVHPTTGWVALRWPHVKLLVCINVLAVSDVIAVVMCGQSIMKNGPSVSIFFAFESAIMLTSVISNSLLWYLHLLDGIFHYLHEKYDATSRMHRLIHPWKDHKATLIFAVELQAQAAKFTFYLTFFAIVMTYYGLPINLIREVYMSFHSLKTRLVAFNKYRKLMSSMNRFSNPTIEDLEEEHTCIICRDEMTVETSKRLPGCGHIFHKSCLREWLVQQQTCPTCRGDISSNEARQKAQDMMNAHIQERQQQQDRDRQQEEQKTKEEEDTEGGKQDDQSIMGRTSAVENTINTSQTSPDGIEPALTEDVNDLDRKPSTMGSTPNEVKQVRAISLERGIPTSDNGSASKECSAFPAFYRVIQDTGASVYIDGDMLSASEEVRVVSIGIIFLGQKMDYRKCNGENRLMVRMPDGWVNDDDVERIIAVPFE